jgi:hypothetical protein
MHICFPNLEQLKDLLLSMQFRPKKGGMRWHLVIDQFLFLAIEVFRCLHKHVDMFLHKCANAIWSLKKPKGPPLLVLVTFFYQRILVVLQRMSQSHFEGGVRSPLTFLKMGLGSLPGFLKTQSVIAGVKTPRIEAFFIPLENS